MVEPLWCNHEKSIKGKVNNWVIEKNPDLTNSQISDIQRKIDEQFSDFDSSGESAKIEEESSLPMTALVGEEKMEIWDWCKPSQVLRS